MKIFSNGADFIISENVILRRYLLCMNHDMDKTKQLIEHSYSMRTKHPAIFYNRDPVEEKIRNIHDIV